MNKCTWRQDYEGDWETMCGHYFIINEGTPTENSMRFCCYCGLPLVEEKYADSESA